MKAVLVGCGNIGYRHLQSLASIKELTEIFVVEPNENRLSAVTRGDLKPKFNGALKGFFNIESLLLEIQSVDFLISAVTADKQLQIIDKLSPLKISNLTLEKPLGQSMGNIERLQDSLKLRKETQVFVNCPMPTWQFYKHLKKTLDKPLHLEFSGCNWGFGCNSIHYIDLFRSLTNAKKLTIIHSSIVSNPFPAKRGLDYEEFIGSCAFQTENGDELHLSCSASSVSTVSIAGSAKTKSLHFIFDECVNKAYNVTEDKSINMGITYVSQSTALFIDSLIKVNQENVLPTLEEAMISHEALFEVLTQSLKRSEFRIT